MSRQTMQCSGEGKLAGFVARVRFAALLPPWDLFIAISAAVFGSVFAANVLAVLVHSGPRELLRNLEGGLQHEGKELPPIFMGR